MQNLGYILELVIFFTIEDLQARSKTKPILASLPRGLFGPQLPPLNPDESPSSAETLLDEPPPILGSPVCAIRLGSKSADGSLRSRHHECFSRYFSQAAFITQDYNRFIIDLSELSIEGTRRNVEIELVVRRSFASYSTEQEIFWTGTIPRR